MRYISTQAINANWGGDRLNWPKGHAISQDLYDSIPENIKNMFEPVDQIPKPIPTEDLESSNNHEQTK